MPCQVAAAISAIGAAYAIGRTHVNNLISAAERVANQPIERAELDGELFYSVRPMLGLILRPNVQYVVDPGGRDDRKSAVVLCLKTAVSF